MNKINLVIKGMHCKSCEMLIKDELIEAGVKDCIIDHKSGRAAIIFDKSKLDLKQIKSVIESNGYKVV